MDNITIECPNCNRILDLKFIIGQQAIPKNNRICHVCHQPYSKKREVIHTKHEQTSFCQRQPEITKEDLEKLKPKKEIIYSGETKMCKCCNIELPIEEFIVGIKKRFVNCKCKKCVTANSVKYYHENKKSIQKKVKEMTEEDRKIVRRKVNEYRRKMKAEHPEYFKLKQIRIGQQRRLSRRIRNRLSQVLKGQRGVSFSKMLGCSSSELRSHLESKFLSGMTWENYGYGHGKWVIDHIKPMCLFDKTLKSDLIQSCHYSNLQPLWYDMNEAKSSNYDPDHPMGWRGLDKFLIERGEPTPWLDNK